MDSNYNYFKVFKGKVYLELTPDMLEHLDFGAKKFPTPKSLVGQWCRASKSTNPTGNTLVLL